MSRQIRRKVVAKRPRAQKLSKADGQRIDEALAEVEDLWNELTAKLVTRDDSYSDSNSDSLYDCLVCGKTYSYAKISSLIDHVEGHAKDQPIQCRLCVEYFRNTSKFRPHLINSCQYLINKGKLPHEPHRGRDQIFHFGNILSRASAEFESHVNAAVDNSSSLNKSETMRNLLLDEWAKPARWAGNHPSESKLRVAQAQAHIIQLFTHSCHLCGMTFGHPRHLHEHAAEHETNL